MADLRNEAEKKWVIVSRCVGAIKLLHNYRRPMFIVASV